LTDNLDKPTYNRTTSAFAQLLKNIYMPSFVCTLCISYQLLLFCTDRSSGSRQNI